MIYQIDGTNANSRIDWKHKVLPAASQERTEEQFPGIAERMSRTGPSMPPDIEVTGFIEGGGADVEAMLADLNGNLLLAASYKGDGETHTVHVGGLDWEECELVEFNTIGEITPSAAGVRVPVRFRWRQLKFGETS